MSTRVADSLAYRHLWTAPELDRLFDERGRLQCWLDILAALARAQASLGIIAAESARLITEHADAGRLDLERIAAETRRTGHSTLGLIHELQRIVPAPAREHVYYGATVQDLTDTWFGLVMRDVGALVGRQAVGAGGLAARTGCDAPRHRHGRSHARAAGSARSPSGSRLPDGPTSCGAIRTGCVEGRRRWAVGQLAGAVGVLGFYGDDRLELRRRFCAELGLG